MRRLFPLLLALTTSQQASANDWEKFYRPLPIGNSTIPSTEAPEVIASSGNPDADIETMWRRGFGIIGYTAFETGNSNTKDAVRLAKKLHARYLIVGTNLESTRTTTIPLTMPTTTTSYSRGNVQAYGTGGSAHGSYSGTTTTYGSQTTYLPYQVNRFRKTALYFSFVPKIGAGILTRELTPDEVAKFETRRAVAVQAIRDGSPAYLADILPGDIILTVNGNPADLSNLQKAASGPQPIKVQIARNGALREIDLEIPTEWQPH